MDADSSITLRGRINNWDMELQKIEATLAKQLDSIRQTRRGFTSLRIALAMGIETVSSLAAEGNRQDELQGEVDKIIDSVQNTAAAIADPKTISNGAKSILDGLVGAGLRK